MSGFVIDDPMLALIARFAGCCKELEESEEEFLREQLLQVRAYVERFPPEERQERALEWISRNAQEYRRKWHGHVMAGQASASRCPDCPLEQRHNAVTCEIHNRWLTLLNGYVGDDASSRQYVEETLNLLRRHKEQLRKSVSRVVGA